MDVYLSCVAFVGLWDRSIASGGGTEYKTGHHGFSFPQNSHQRPPYFTPNKGLHLAEKSLWKQAVVSLHMEASRKFEGFCFARAVFWHRDMRYYKFPINWGRDQIFSEIETQIQTQKVRRGSCKVGSGSLSEFALLLLGNLIKKPYNEFHFNKSECHF